MSNQTDTVEYTERKTEPKFDDGGEHDRFAHYVRNEAWMVGYLGQGEVEALCGKIWVPSRDPEKYPICPECKEIWEAMPPGDDDA